MAIDLEKLRAQVRDLLEQNKGLTEKEVKEKAARTLRVKPADVSGGIVREVRKSMGIDRPSALSFARDVLKKDPGMEARTLIQAVGERFGIRIGPPDVSRLRPASAKARTGRKPGPKPGMKRAAQAPAPAPAGPRPVVKLGKGEIAVVVEAKGKPGDVARFFESIGKAARRG